ncbi:MAG: hypothetical protein ABID38_05945 [Candidatus Diapherotrites archaeon]
MDERIYNAAKISVQSGNGLEETIKDLEEKYGPLSEEQIAAVEEIIGEMKGRRPSGVFIKVFLVIAFLLLGSGIFLFYLEFFEHTKYTANECDSSPVEIQLSGNRDFRLMVKNSLNLLMNNDCDSFLFVATNTKSIEQSAYWPILLSGREPTSRIRDGRTPIYSIENESQIIGVLYRAACIHAKLSEGECNAMMLDLKKEYPDEKSNIIGSEDFDIGYNIDFNLLIPENGE